MTIGDLQIGQWFKICDDRDGDMEYMKIQPTEDRWGNIFVAVSRYGILEDSESLPNFCCIEPIVNQREVKYLNKPKEKSS